MLDTYWWGKVERISPEAPVPVVALHKKEQRMGGAGNVALNTVSLGAQTTMFTIVGKDEDAETLITLLKKNEGINTDYIIQSSQRITTNKIRIISRNQQMLRLDSEITKDITHEEEQQLTETFKKFIHLQKTAGSNF